MRLAVMQPYIFPYVGYYQLLVATDKFVIYDDVNFIKQGWINRNNILLNGRPYLFTIPLESVSSFKKINEVKLSERLYDKWLMKFEKTLKSAYHKAPYYRVIAPLIMDVFLKGRLSFSLTSLCTTSLTAVMDFLDIKRIIEPTSAIYKNTSLDRFERLIDICQTEKATTYINPIGGVALYEKELFESKGIELLFLKAHAMPYLQQLDDTFVPNLSVIDILMFNSPDEIKELFKHFVFE